MNQRPIHIPPELVTMALQEWLVPATEDGVIDGLWQAFIEEFTPYARQIIRRVLVREMPQRIDDGAMLNHLGEFMTKLIDDLESITVTSLEDSRRRSDIVSAMRDWSYTIANRPSATSSEAQVSAALAEVLARGDVP